VPRDTSGLKRGGPGRPKGVPNKATRAIKEVAQAIIERPEYLSALQRRLDSGRAPHMETLLYHYAYGKPKDVTEHQGQVRLKVTWEQ
jgi:hypothetical protein